VIVLEEGDFPIPFGMTAFTLLGKVALMLVVLFVAGVAVGRRLVLVQMPRMTRLALCCPMLPSKRIGGIVIVLKEEGFPIPFGMAAFTLLGKVPLMLVVLFVAGKAGDRRLVLV
jgi:hypothetical protein